MLYGWKAGVFAGIASSFLFLIPTTGVPIVGLLLFFVPLPLFLAGLSSGTSSALIGVFTAIVISSLATDFASGLLVYGSIGLPAVVLTSLALLNRTVRFNDDEIVEWYPAGRILVWLSGFAATVLIFLAASAHLGQGTDLVEQARQLVIETHGGREQIAALLTEFQSPLTPDQYVIILASILPPFIALNLSFMTAANAGLAQLILIRVGQAIRPSPSLRDLELPEGAAIALAGCTGLWLLPGEIGYIGGSLAVIFLIPYFLLGLIVVHAISTAWSGRQALLILLYLICVLFTGMAFLIALLGIAEQWFHLRQRYGVHANSGKTPKGK